MDNWRSVFSSNHNTPSDREWNFRIIRSERPFNQVDGKVELVSWKKCSSYNQKPFTIYQFNSFSHISSLKLWKGISRQKEGQLVPLETLRVTIGLIKNVSTKKIPQRWDPVWINGQKRRSRLVPIEVSSTFQEYPNIRGLQHFLNLKLGSWVIFQGDFYHFTPSGGVNFV